MATESEIDLAEKMKANKKATIAYLKERAKELARSMAKSFEGGFYQLAANDAKLLSDTMTVLGQVDLT